MSNKTRQELEAEFVARHKARVALGEAIQTAENWKESLKALFTQALEDEHEAAAALIAALEQ